MVFGRMHMVPISGLLIASLASSSVFAADEIDYERDVKSILKAHCFRCHGPLKAKALALMGGENGAALVPGEAAESKIVQRITGDDETRMPPEGERLSDAQVETLKKWIAGGAVSPANEAPVDPRAHWSFQPIKRPAVPSGAGADWSRNPIDAFISRRHQAGKVTPRPAAPRHVLLRRVYLDLIGLPPSRDELRAFMADNSPDAYHKAVDRLLASPHYGERWGRHWLDVWRYSDWYGFQGTVRFSQKNIWHWRDWTIESLNADKGYERMLMEMLAGDEILPFDPANLRATGFLVRNRNTDSREQWLRQTVEHTSQAFFGLTMACVQCHDHPYDPVWHDEYYRFRNIFEPVSVAIDSGGGGPGGVDIAGVARIFDQNRGAGTKFYIRGNDKTPDESRKITPGVPQVIGNWTEPKEVSLPPVARVPHLRKTVADQTLARLEHNIRAAEQAIKTGEAFVAETKRQLAADSQDASEPSPDTFLLDTFKPGRGKDWREGPGQWDDSNGHLTQSTAGAEQFCWLQYAPNRKPLRDFRLRARFKITGGENLRVGITYDLLEKAGRSQGVFLIAGDEKPGLGFYFEYDGDKSDLSNLFREFDVPLDQEFVLRVDVRDQLANVYVNDVLMQAHKVAMREAGGFRLWTQGASAEFHHIRMDPLPADTPMAPAESTTKFASVASLDKSDPSHLSFATTVVDHARVTLDVRKAEQASHQATWTADAFRLLEAPAEGDEAAAAAHKKRHEELAMVANQAQKQLALAKARETRFLAEHVLNAAKARAAHGPKGDATLSKAVADATNKVETTGAAVEKASLALKEPPKPQYSGLSGNYGSSSGRRLSLARWVADSTNPLTARVAVNHIWLRHFERALVATVFDFGLNGSKPSHPQLLDWLASELREPSQVLSTQGGQPQWTAGEPSAKAWSMKHLHRVIVTSRTYRTASTPDEADLRTDPDNAFYWRMPPRRMDAEIVRDCVLAAAGALDRKLGGPDIPCADGMSTPRRSIYFHQSPESQMSFLKLFDGADTTECYQRHVSIVPHQALALFNSEVSLVQSRRLARHLSRKLTATEPFIQAAFEQVLSRSATETELRIGAEFLAARQAVYESQEKSAADKKDNSGSENSPSAEPRQHARENLVHALFNHHDFVTIK